MRRWLRIILMFLVIYILVGIILGLVGSSRGILKFGFKQMGWIFIWPIGTFVLSIGQYGEHLLISVLIHLVVFAFIIWLSFFIDKKWFRKKELENPIK